MSSAFAGAELRGFLTSAVQVDAGGVQRLELLVEGVHCANCIGRIERSLGSDARIDMARVNLTLRKLSLAWRGKPELAEEIGARVSELGYPVAPYDPGSISTANRKAGNDLLRALAIAGFASANVMMLAWAVWSGQAQDMGPGTQALFNWLSALVAMPTLAVAGQVFFRSAYRALRAGRTNMDVPISAALVLASAISMVELLRGGQHVYFDSAMMLLFVLLIGRYLDCRTRARAREAIERLAMLRAVSATVMDAAGHPMVVAAAQVTPGTLVRVATDEVMPVDGVILRGAGVIDKAAVTGESHPETMAAGAEVLAGYVNRGAALDIRATRLASDSHLARILRLVEVAQLEKGAAATLADRLSAIWTPLVHGVALVTFVGWMLAGAGFQTALLHAVTVLIIACPCAIGLAIPAVQIVVIGGLLRSGILVRSGGALERLALVSHILFDKTGTLTTGRADVIEIPANPALHVAASALAATSRHPFSRAISRHLGSPTVPATEVTETPGGGLVGMVEGCAIHLGSAAFCGAPDAPDDGFSSVWVAAPRHGYGRFLLADLPRHGAAEVIAAFHRQGMTISILSGDQPGPVAACAEELGISEAAANQRPDDKAAYIAALRATGAKVLMVGDGLNDAQALASADVSASFGHGAATTQVAADFVLPEGGLDALNLTHRTAARAARIVRQNLGFALIYNSILIPVAVLGLVTPLIAAMAMSASSILVTLNALRARPAPVQVVP